MGFAGILKQSTAVDVLIGPFVDSTDGDTEETALTITAADVRLSKNGQNMAAKNDATACVHDELGMYNCELDATDTNTVGQLTLSVHEAGALLVRHDFQVMEEVTYDALYGAAAAGFDANGRVDVGSWLGNAVTASAGNPDVNIESIDANAITATAIATDAITNAKIAADAIGASEIAANAIGASELATDAIGGDQLAATGTAEIANAVWDEAMVETTGAPAVTGTFRAAIEWIFALSRNKMTQTATTSTLRNDADAADLSTSTISDDGTTATRGEWTT